MSELTYRKANVSDSRDLFEWRNDQQSREASINRDLVTWEGHEKWLTAKLNSDDTFMLIFELSSQNSSKVGMTRFDLERHKGIAEISINVNPTFRGHGLAEKLLSESIELFASAETGIHLINATIRESNVASTKIFIRSGFTEVSRAEGFVHYSLSIN